MSGRGSLLRLDGWTWEDMTIDADAGLVVSWPRTEPITARWMQKSEDEQRKEIAKDLERIEQLFDEAAAYLQAIDADPIDGAGPSLRSDAPGPQRGTASLRAGLLDRDRSSRRWPGGSAAISTSSSSAARRPTT